MLYFLVTGRPGIDLILPLPALLASFVAGYRWPRFREKKIWASLLAVLVTLPILALIPLAHDWLSFQKQAAAASIIFVAICSLGIIVLFSKATLNLGIRAYNEHQTKGSLETHEKIAYAFKVFGWFVASIITLNLLFFFSALAALGRDCDVDANCM